MMMKAITLFWAATTLVGCSYLNNKHVITDPSLIGAIVWDCPACIDSSGTLTEVADTLTSLQLVGSHIKDWSGFNFPALKMLFITESKAMSLPANLPPSLEVLDCSNNELTSLPEHLPKNLKTLNCSYNQLASLPAQLPKSLNMLRCNNNELTSLPELSQTQLSILDCSNNPLTSLPTLPETLRALGFINTKVSCLPNLPRGLTNNRLPICER